MTHDRRSFRMRFESHLYRGYKRIRHAVSRNARHTHVFVAGLQRSGTNMLMEVLEWSPHTDVYHETDRRAFDERYEMRDPVTIRRLSQSSRAPFFVIKALCELDRLGELLDDFMPAKAVWILRHYHDSSQSAVRSFRNFVPQLRRLAQDKTSDAWRGRGMSDVTQAVLRRIAALDPSELDGAAMMWYYRNALFFEQRLDRDPRVALLMYEDWASHPTARLNSLCRFLGLPRCSHFMTRYVHGNAVHRRPPPTLLPEVEEACTQLMGQFLHLERI